MESGMTKKSHTGMMRIARFHVTFEINYNHMKP